MLLHVFLSLLRETLKVLEFLILSFLYHLLVVLFAFIIFLFLHFRDLSFRHAAVDLLHLKSLINDQKHALDERHGFNGTCKFPEVDEVLRSRKLEEEDRVCRLRRIVGVVHGDKELVFSHGIGLNVLNRAKLQRPQLTALFHRININTSVLIKSRKESVALLKNDLFTRLIQQNLTLKRESVLVPDAHRLSM